MKKRWIGKSPDGNSVTLYKLTPEHFQIPNFVDANWLTQESPRLKRALVVDVETTGLDQGPTRDEIIEIGVRSLLFHQDLGLIVEAGTAYCEYEDPGMPIPEKITEITGITDADVRGKKIDWTYLEQIFSEADLILSHNAEFDRKFIDRKIKISASKIWACSMRQVSWADMGFPSAKLEFLNIFHGYFTDSHRALNDVDALVHLLMHSHPETNQTYFSQLFANSQKTSVEVFASRASFDSKDELKGRSYRWNPTTRVWWKTIDQDQLDAEMKWMEDKVYHGQFLGDTRVIPLVDRFKARS